MVILNKSCCYFSLNIGTAIIGWFQAVGSLLILILGIIALSCTAPIAKKTHTNEQQVAIFGIFMAIAASIWIFVSSLLILGSMKRNKFLLLPWLILVGLYLTVEYLQLISVLFMGVNYEVFMAGLISVLLSTYFYLIVLSFFLEINKEKLQECHSMNNLKTNNLNDGLPPYSTL